MIHDEEILDVGQVEKKLVAELGNNVCIYERICVEYAEQTLQRRSWERVLNWNEVFRYDINCNIVTAIVYLTISIKTYSWDLCFDKNQGKTIILEKKLKMYTFDIFITKGHTVVANLSRLHYAIVTLKFTA